MKKILSFISAIAALLLPSLFLADDGPLDVMNGTILSYNLETYPHDIWRHAIVVIELDNVSGDHPDRKLTHEIWLWMATPEVEKYVHKHVHIEITHRNIDEGFARCYMNRVGELYQLEKLEEIPISKSITKSK